MVAAAGSRRRWHPPSALGAAVAFCNVASAVGHAAVARAVTNTHSQIAHGIINGTVVRNPSGTHSFFALPTGADYSDNWLGCGASIISPTFGLTSAHCFGGGLDPCSGPRQVALWLGDVEIKMGSIIVPASKGKSFRVVADVICSPDFNGKCSHGHDIALLKLRQKLPAWVKPVPVSMGTSSLSLAAGASVRSVGFGLTESKNNPTVIAGVSPTLRQVSVQVMTEDSAPCARVFSGGWGCSDEHSEGAAVNRHQQLCAGAADGRPRDTCAGDSGSPMLDASGTQVGIVSYGGGPGEKMSGPGRMCGDPDYPGVYARVSAFADFLRANVPDLPGVSRLHMAQVKPVSRGASGVGDT